MNNKTKPIRLRRAAHRARKQAGEARPASAEPARALTGAARPAGTACAQSTARSAHRDRITELLDSSIDFLDNIPSWLAYVSRNKSRSTDFAKIFRRFEKTGWSVRRARFATRSAFHRSSVMFRPTRPAGMSTVVKTALQSARSGRACNRRCTRPYLAAAACPCALPRTVRPRVNDSAVASPAPQTTGILMKFVDAGLPGVRRDSCSAITEACRATRRHRRLPADVRNDGATMCARPIAARGRTAGQSSCLWRFLFLCLLPW